MNFLMIAPEPFFAPRGTPISVYQRLRALSSLGHKVDLLTYHLGESVEIPGVEVHRIPRIPFINMVKAGPSWRKLVLDFFVLGKAILMLGRKKYDVIHSHEEAAFFSIFLSALFRTRHVYDMHSSLPRQLENFRFANYRPVIMLFELLERWTLNTCDAVITISCDLAEYVKALKPELSHVMVENLPVQTSISSLDQDGSESWKAQLGLNGKLSIVYTGNFSRYQGLDLLIESAEVVKREHPEAVFILVGGMPHQIEFWRHKVRTSRLEDSFRFVGTVRVEDIPAFLDLAQILVSPRTAGTSVPLKIYTYLLSGKPIVATNLTAHTQVLNEDIAVLVAPTREGLAEGISRLIKSPDLGQQMAHRAKDVARVRYDPSAYLSKIEEVCQFLEASAGPLAETTHSLRN